MAKANGQHSTDCWPLNDKVRRAQLPGDIGRPSPYYGEVPEAGGQSSRILPASDY